MDIEQLKMILDMLGAAGEGARELAYVWFGLVAMKLVGYYTLWVIGFYTAYKGALRVVSATSLGQRLCDMAGAYGTCQSDRQRMIDLVQSGLDREAVDAEAERAAYRENLKDEHFARMENLKHGN